MEPPDLADQLTLSQPSGADYAHQIILAPPDFQTFRRRATLNPQSQVRVFLFIT